MTFEDAVNYLNSLIDYEKRVPGKYDTETYNLNAFQSLLERLGNPHQQLDAVHVAGTDGKGSTCAFLESILRHAGMSTGFYCSPHLSSYAERIRLGGKPIPGEMFGQLVEETRQALDRMQTENSQPARRGFATVFEILTAAAFLAFARAKVDVAIVEVGLGGRLDATNVVLPRLSVIVPVDRDHTRLLGTTPAEIAREKGGIIKHGTPVVVSPQSNEVMAVLEAAAHDKESCLIRSEAVYTIDPVQQSAEEYRFHLRGPARTLANLHIPLVGHHQVSNARTAVVAAEEFLQASGRRLSAREVRDGLGATRWPGRFETVSFGGSDATPVPCILDCAHTPQAGRALRRTLEETQAQPAFVFLLSLSGDKQVSDFLHALLRPGDVVVATRSDSPRAMSPEQICQTAEGVLSGSGLAASHCSHAASDWESGLALAIRLARQTNRPLCVAGSIYLVGLVRSRAEAAHTV